MNIHRTITAWISIVFGGYGLLTVAFFGLVAAGILHLGQFSFPGMPLLAFIGAAWLWFIGLTSLLDIIAGIYLLRGAGWAKVWIVISSVLSLAKFPIGTLTGAYSLWALLLADKSFGTAAPLANEAPPSSLKP